MHNVVNEADGMLDASANGTTIVVSTRDVRAEFAQAVSVGRFNYCSFRSHCPLLLPELPTPFRSNGAGSLLHIFRSLEELQCNGSPIHPDTTRDDERTSPASLARWLDTRRDRRETWRRFPLCAAPRDPPPSGFP
jgi:hypothetical protein